MNQPETGAPAIVLPLPPLPEAGERWALLLDIDGTLVDFSAHPDDVHVPIELGVLLDRVRLGLDGALGILSGRTLADVDRLLAPWCFPTGALHGSEHRDPSGRVTVFAAPATIAESIRAACA